MLIDVMESADFSAPISSIMSHNTTSTSDCVYTWKGMGNYEDTQQRHFHTHQPKKTLRRHQYRTRSQSGQKAERI